ITKKQRESFIEICDKDATTLNDELEIDEEILNDGDNDLPILNETQWSGVVEEWANLLNDENLEEEINVRRVESESSDDDDEILPEDSKAKWKLENLF
ncbi:8501_t:CDS:1, partial [Funneliformis geosporum]